MLSISATVINRFLFLFFLLSAISTQLYAFSEIMPDKNNEQLEISAPLSCPPNTRRVGLPDVCLEIPLPTDTLYFISGATECPSPYLKQTGISTFCILPRHYLDMFNGNYVIRKQKQPDCLENFTRRYRSENCSAKRLALDIRDDKLKLVDPVFEAQQTTSFSTLQTANKVGQNSKRPTYRNCLAKYFGTPSQKYCLSDKIIKHSNPARLGLTIPSVCPSYWEKLSPKGLCEPAFNIKLCDKNWPCENSSGDTLKLTKEPLNCGDYDKSTIFIPTYDQNAPSSLTFIPAYACAPPDKFD